MRVFFLVLLTLIGTRAPAQVILTETANNLFDTGLSNLGVLLPVATADPHYVLVTNPSNTGTNSYGTTLANWVANQSAATPPSEWISFNSTHSNGVSNGIYDYQLSLTNIPVGALVTISGQVAADDQIVIDANGTAKYTHTGNSYNAFTSFNFTFYATAANELDFLVNNSGGGATGLQVSKLSGSYTVPVPEVKFTPWFYLLGACLVTIIAGLRKLLFPRHAS